MSSDWTGTFKMLFSQTEEYYFIRTLGKGVFGRVARFRRRSDRKLVSIKLVPRKFNSMSFREAQMLAAIADDETEHHIVRFYEAFQNRHFYCIVEETMDQNLVQFRKSNGLNEFNVWDIRTMILQILIALAKLKDMGFVHTDIKQDNIMLVNQRRHSFRVKLIDFGCATTIHRLASNWTPCIQPRFIRAPEVILGISGCNVKVDMWSVGCVMGEMALGRKLFPSKCELELAHAIFGTRGLPSARMLDTGVKTRLFFDKIKVGDNAYEWNLKPCTGQELPSGTQSLRRSVAAKLDSLYAIEDGEVRAEMADRKCMVELLDRMLTLEPDHRITPNQALRHPFLTLQHLSGCEQHRNYYNFSLQRYSQAGVTLPPAFFTRLLTRCRRKQRQGAKDGLSLEDSAIPEDMPVNTAETSRTARKKMKKEKNVSETESASSLSDGWEYYTPCTSSSPDVPECTEEPTKERAEEPPKRAGFLRRWQQAISRSCEARINLIPGEVQKLGWQEYAPGFKRHSLPPRPHGVKPSTTSSSSSLTGMELPLHSWSEDFTSDYASLYSLQFLTSAV